MKKLTAVLLALVMVLSLACASAAELTLTFPEINADAGLVCDMLRRFAENVKTGSNGRIISFLAENENEVICQKDIEKEFGITRSTASRVVSLMERKGLVERKAVHHDARLKRVVLTDHSRMISQALNKVGRMIDQKLLNGFSDEEKEQLLSYLERMGNNLE